MSFLVFSIFLLFLSTVSAFSVQVTNDPVAGGSAEVAWRRDFGDPATFYLRLRQLSGNDNGGFTTVKTGTFTGSGTAQVPVPEAGQFMIEVYTNTQNTAQGPRASSSTFIVENPPQQPSPPSQPTTTTTTTTTPDTQPTDPGSGSGGSNTSTSDQQTSTTSLNPPNNGNNPHTTPATTSGKGGNTSLSSGATTASGSLVVVLNPTDGSPLTSTFTPGPTPQVLTLLSDSQTVTTTIGLVGQTSPAQGLDPSSDSSSHSANSHTGAIIGAVLGAVFFVLFVALLFVIYRRRKRQQATNTFYRDKMVRTRASPFGSNPSLAALAAATPTSDVPYTDLKEQIQDYDQTEISVEPKVNTHPEDFDPYAALYQSGRPSYSSGMLAAAQSFHSSDVIPPSDEGIFTISNKSRRSLIPSSVPVSVKSNSSLGLEPPKTDRQMDVHDKIIELQTRMLSLQSWDESEELEELRKRISGLESLMDSPWALGNTDVIPREISDAGMH